MPYCRVGNLGQAGLIDLGRVNLQYWFNGPRNIPNAADPLSQFSMDCLDATTGASSQSAAVLGAPSG